MKKITAVSLTNWRNHENTSAEIKPVTFFLGPNGSGKSSIRAGIEYALTGRVDEWTDARGAGSSDLIRGGKKSAVVGVHLDDRDVTRWVPGSLEVDGFEGTTGVQEQLLYKALGTSKDVITALMNVRNFARLAPKDQKDLLLGIMDVRITRDGLIEALAKFGMDTPTVLDAVGHVFPKGSHQDTLGPEAIDALLKRAREERTVYGRDVKKLEALIEMLGRYEKDPSPILPDNVTADQFIANLGQLDKVKDRLEALKKSRDLVLKAAGDEGAVNLRKQKSERMATLKEENVERLAALDMESVTSSDLKKMEATKEGVDKKIDAADEAREKATEALRDVMSDITAHTTALTAFDSDDGVSCPLAGSVEVSCPMTKTAKAKIVKELKTELAKLKTKKKTIDKRVEACAERNQEVHIAREKATVRLDLGKEVRDCSQEIMGLASEIAALPAAVNVDQNELTDLNDRISTGEAVAKLVESHEQEKATAVDGLEIAIKAHKAADSQVKAFGPDGIKTSLVGDKVGELQTSMNAWLDQLMPGFSVEVTASPTFSMIVTTALGAEVPMALLSDSEKYRMGLVVQAALASLTDLGWLIIDGADILQGPDQKAFMGFVKKMSKTFGTIIVFATTKERPKKPIGSVTYWVEDGTVEQI